MFLFQPMLSVSYWPEDSTSSSSSPPAELSTGPTSSGEGVKKSPQMQRLLKNRMTSGMRLQRSRNVATKEKEQSLWITALNMFRFVFYLNITLAREKGVLDKSKL